MSDFRVRKTGSVFYVWQRIGSGWERMSYPHASRSDALRWIANAQFAG